MSISKPSRKADVRQAKYSGKHTVNMSVDMGAVNAVLAKLEGDIHKAVRPAAQAAADVLYKAVLQNVDRIGSVTGNLRASIYQAFSEEHSQVASGGGYARATYHVSWRTGRRKGEAAGLPTAPHGHLIEFGHIQRYAVHLSKNGHWYTVIRPEHFKVEVVGGKRKRTLIHPRPKRDASQAEKDAYYVLRPGGPVQQPARPFLRPAFYKQGEAAAAAKAKIFEILGAR